MVNTEKTTRGNGRRAILDNRQNILDYLAQGYTLANVYDMLNIDTYIKRSTFYYHTKKLILPYLESSNASLHSMQREIHPHSNSLESVSNIIHDDSMPSNENGQSKPIITAVKKSIKIQHNPTPNRDELI